MGIGLRTARELPGRDVTEALATELTRLSVDRRPLLLLALADRSDEAVLPVVVMAARCPKEVRLAALDVLMRLGNVSCVPTLLAAAAEVMPEWQRPCYPGTPARRERRCRSSGPSAASDGKDAPGSSPVGRGRQMGGSWRIMSASQTRTLAFAALR
jgi:hypothetical protein